MLQHSRYRLSTRITTTQQRGEHPLSRTLARHVLDQQTSQCRLRILGIQSISQCILIHTFHRRALTELLQSQITQLRTQVELLSTSPPLPPPFPPPVLPPLSQQQESLAALLADMEATTLAAATARQALAKSAADGGESEL